MPYKTPRTHWMIGPQMHTKLAKRITAYIGKIPEAVSGSGGHIQTFYVAKILIHGFGLTETEAFPFIKEYSARCAPPWSDKELKHKLASARKSAGGDIKKLR
jgi:hypothetical protein